MRDGPKVVPKKHNFDYFTLKSTCYGGERGIRTLDRVLAYTPLAGVRLQPLGQLSGLNVSRGFSVGVVPLPGPRIIPRAALYLRRGIIPQPEQNQSHTQEQEQEQDNYSCFGGESLSSSWMRL